MYVYTDEFSDEFQPPPFSTYSYKVCRLFGTEDPTEGTCSGTVKASNYSIEPVERPQMPTSPGAGLGG
jgi:hypothetical protein